MTIAQRGDLRPGALRDRGQDLDEAIAMAKSHPLANAASIYTSNGASARKFTRRSTPRWSA